LREHEIVEAEKIACMVEGVDLTGAILVPGGEACDALEQDREAFRLVRAADDRLAAPNLGLLLHQLPKCLDFGSIRHAERIEPLADGGRSSGGGTLLHASAEVSLFPHRGCRALGIDATEELRVDSLTVGHAGPIFGSEINGCVTQRRAIYTSKDGYRTHAIDDSGVINVEGWSKRPASW